MSMPSKKAVFGLLAALLLLAIIFGGFIYTATVLWQRLNRPSPTGTTPPAAASEVWKKTPAVPVDTVLLVLPVVWEDTGLLDEDTKLMMRSHESMLMRSWPRNVGLISSAMVLQLMSDTAPYRADWLLQTSVDFESALIALTKPTHTLSYKLDRMEEGKIHVVATLTKGETTWTREDDCAIGELTSVASRTLRWALEQGGMTRDAAVLSAHDVLPGDPDLWRSYDTSTEETRAAWEDASHPLWDRVDATLTGDPVLYNLRCFIARNKKDTLAAARLVGEPLDASAPMGFQLGRARMLMTQGREVEAVSQFRQILATYPGAMRWADEYFAEGKDAGRYVDRVADAEEWAKRVPESPYVAWSGGALHQDVAQEYRGTGWSNTVTPEGWKGYREHNEKAMALLSRAVSSGGLLPSISNIYCSLLFVSDRKQEALDIHERTIKAWPDSDKTWYSVTNFLLPRWYGYEGEAIALMNEGMERNPGNGRMINVVTHYHKVEARSKMGELKANNFDYMNRYAMADPAAKTQLEKMFELARNPNIKQVDRARAFMVASNAQNYVICHDLMKTDPQLWESIDSWNDEQLGAEAARSAVWTLVDGGNWEEAGKALDWAVERDKKLTREGKPCGVVGFCMPFEPRTLHQFIVLARDGETKNLEAIRESVKESLGFACVAGVAAYLANDVQESDLQNVLTLQADPVYSIQAQSFDVSALLYAKLGRMEQAHTDYFRAIELSADNPYCATNPWARAEVERLLGITPDEPATE